MIFYPRKINKTSDTILTKGNQLTIFQLETFFKCTIDEM